MRRDWRSGDELIAVAEGRVRVQECLTTKGAVSYRWMLSVLLGT
jgi:hypothetical protein